MSGIALTTDSPSSSSNMRNTPCVDGCCGPMFNTMVLVVPAAVSTVVIALGSGASLAWTFGGIISAQRMPLPIIGQQNPPQIRMSRKAHAKKIEYFPLQPIGSRPNRYQRIHDRVISWNAGAQTQPLAARNGNEMILQFKSRLDRVTIHAGGVGKQIEL